MLLLSFFVMGSAGTANRGLTVSIKNAEGETIPLYSESHALLIGISNYQQWPILESVPGELATVENILLERGFSVEKHLNLTGDQLEDVFDDFIDNYGFAPENQLLFYFSGHGWTHPDGRKGYLVPSDAPNPTRDKQGFLRSALAMTQVLAWARQAEAKHALFLFDSCFSGTIFQTKTLPTDPPHITNATSLPVRQFITAGSAGEEVPAQSVFTPAFVDAMTYGYGDLNEDGYVSGTELGLYLQNTVSQYTNQHPQFGKIQDFDLSRGDFIFILPPGEKPKEQDKVASLAPVTSDATSSSSVGTTIYSDLTEVTFWDSIKDSDQPKMLEAYLEEYPSGNFIKLAKLKLELLQEKTTSRAEVSFWNSIKDANDSDMLEAYLYEYPDGEFVSLAKIKLGNLEKTTVEPLVEEKSATEKESPTSIQSSPTEANKSITLIKKSGDTCPEGKIQTFKGCEEIAKASQEVTDRQIVVEKGAAARALNRAIALAAQDEAERKAAAAETPAESAEDEPVATASSDTVPKIDPKIDPKTGYKWGENPNKTSQQNAMDKHRARTDSNESMDKHREWTALCRDDPDHNKCKKTQTKGGGGSSAGGGGGGSTWYCRYRYWTYGYGWGPWGPWEPC